MRYVCNVAAIVFCCHDLVNNTVQCDHLILTMLEESVQKAILLT